MQHQFTKIHLLFFLILLIIFVPLFTPLTNLNKYEKENITFEIEKPEVNITKAIEVEEPKEAKKCYNATPEINYTRTIAWLDPETIQLSCVIHNLEKQEVNVSAQIRLFIEKEELLDVIASKDVIFLPPNVVAFPKENLTLEYYGTVTYSKVFRILDPRLYEEFWCYVEPYNIEKCE